MRFIKYPKIRQFRDIIRDIQHNTWFTGLNDQSEPMYNKTLELPTLTVNMSEKIHGSNLAFCMTNTEHWVQSRKNILTPEKDNAACAFHVNANINEWKQIVYHEAATHGINLNESIICIFAEWAGGGIQKNSALSNLPKTSILFPHFGVVPINNKETPIQWFKSTYIPKTPNIIKTIELEPIQIDFNHPLLSVNIMNDIVDKIEQHSPLGQSLGKSDNIGEGIVCTLEYKNQHYKLKIKGEKHSKTKVKILEPVDNILEQKKIDFANYAANPDRLEGIWASCFGISDTFIEPTTKDIAAFMRALHKDVMEEESDIMAEQELEPKQVNKMISTIARRWFFEQLNNLAGI